MRKINIFILVFLVTQSFFFIEEETLILLASLVWLDAAGGFIRKILESELENRGDIIKNKFSWYLQQKENLLENLVKEHKKRAEFVSDISKVYSYIVREVLEKIIAKVLLEEFIVERYLMGIDLEITGSSVVNDIFVNDLEKIMYSFDREEIEEKNWLSN